MQPSYRVPKRKLTLRVRTTASDREETVRVFLSDHAETHPGREEAVDVFNGPNDFVVVEDESGSIQFLNRDIVAVVAVPQDEEGDFLDDVDLAARDLDTEIPIAIELDDGTRIEGTARYQMPETHRRLQDFLNSVPPFVSVYRKGELLLLNKSRIARVSER